MYLYQTGLRSGERVGAAPDATQNRGTVMDVRFPPGGYYPPSRQAIENLDLVTLRDRFRDIQFFSTMNVEERRNWLISHATDKTHLYLEDVEMEVRFISISGDFFTQQLSPETITDLLNGQYWSIRKVYELFPRRPGSRARKHTLIFRPSNWIVLPFESTLSSFQGLWLDLDNGQSLQGSGFPTARLTLLDQEIGVKTQPRDTDWNWDSIRELAPDPSAADEIRTLIQWFPPALYKSLIQKLIRTGSEIFTHQDRSYLARDLLFTAFISLALHPGAFVPNIQRYVSGLEGATKRLAVSIAEDSYHSDPNLLSSLLGAALLAQADRSWHPSDKLLCWWLQAAEEARQDRRYFVYRPSLPPPTISTDPHTLSYYLLKTLRSFPSDLELFATIAARRGEFIIGTPISSPLVPGALPLIHIIDQHTYPEIGWYLFGESYPRLFQQLWQDVSSYNPRLKPMTETPFFHKVREAQHLVWLRQVGEKSEIPTTSEEISYETKLPESWLAGLIGTIAIGNNYVVLRPENIYELVALRRPTRGLKPELTDEEREITLQKARDLLRKGYPLLSSSLLPQFKHAHVYLIDDEYYLEYSGISFRNSLQGDKVSRQSGMRKSWHEARHLNYIFPVHQAPILSPSIAIQTYGIGISANSDDRWVKLIEQSSVIVRRRLFHYLQAARSLIELYPISRTGEAQSYTVMPEDSEVNILLHSLAQLYPAALTVEKRGFRVGCGSLLWDLAKGILPAPTYYSGWHIPATNRSLWHHQVESLERMKSNQRRGYLLWIPVGLGKTLIVREYLRYLAEMGKLPKYCLYTLPPSALDSVKREFDGVRTKVLDFRQGSRSRVLEAGTINFVYHDHLRMVDLTEQANEIFFIVDEFHKTLNPTQRTSSALELVRLSTGFIGLSGTIIKDTETQPLIQWLEQVVDFEVTESNYWVAIGALVSKRVQTRVVVERETVEVPLGEDYYSLVPKVLGGSSTQLKFRQALTLSYHAVEEELEQLVRDYQAIGEVVFVVTRDQAHQQRLAVALSDLNVYLIGMNHSLTLLPGDKRGIEVVITTPKYAEGYTLTGSRVMLTGVWFSNQATREQLEGRLNRIGQPSDLIRVITVQAGLLSYVQRRYESARTLSEVMKGFADEIQIPYDELRALLH